jgi:hypothetical protein
VLRAKKSATQLGPTPTIIEAEAVGFDRENKGESEPPSISYNHPYSLNVLEGGRRPKTMKDAL